MKEITYQITDDQPISFAASEKEDNGRTRITMRALSGEVVRHWSGDFIMDMSGMKHSEKIIIDHNHNVDEVLGYVDTFSQMDGQLFLSGEIVSVAPNDRADIIRRQIKSGIPYQASITFRPGKREEHEDEAYEINGRTYEKSATVFKEWDLIGVAITPYGADGSTSVRAFSAGKEKEEEEDKQQEEEEKVDAKTDREILREYISEFGNELGLDYFSRELTEEQARIEYAKHLQCKVREQAERIAELEKTVSCNAEVPHVKPVAFSAEESGLGDEEMQRVKQYAKKYGSNAEDLIAYIQKKKGAR